jgi:hypothetical protein
MPVPVQRNPLENISVGRWKEFSEWVRELSLANNVTDFSYAILYLNATVMDMIEQHFEHNLTQEGTILSCCEILRGILMANISFGAPLEVSYHSKSPPYPDFRFAKYIDLLGAMRKLSNYALFKAISENPNRIHFLEMQTMDVLHEVLEWIQYRSHKNLVELADECMRVFTPNMYEERVKAGRTMANIPIIYE